MAVIFAGIDSIRLLLDVKAPLLVALGLVLLGWAYHAHGFGRVFNHPSAFHTRRAFWTAFFPLVTGVVGFWATVSLNIPDFTRYAKTQRDQVVGQAIGLPFTMALYAFIGIAVTLATGIGDPIALVSTFHSRWVVVAAQAAIVLATLATNIAANVVSPANDFANLAPRFIGFRLGGLLTGLVGIAIMPWKLYADPHGYIFTWLLGSSSLLGAVGGVLIADYWVLRRTRLDVRRPVPLGRPVPVRPRRQLGGRAGRGRRRAAVRAGVRRPADRRRPAPDRPLFGTVVGTSTCTPGSSRSPSPASRTCS